MHTPILLIAFNRPATTLQVFNRLREAKPSILYVAADGPRKDHHGEKKLCNEVRKIITDVDWPCEVKTLFREENLGCRVAVQTAIDWFFENEEEGIILEDDCLPDYDFFNYCTWAIEVYRDKKNVWHINGNNFLAPINLYKNQMISFTALAQVWGWATWRDRWEHYKSDLDQLSFDALKSVKHWHISYIGKFNKLYHLMKLRDGLDTWDYQWQITILNNCGLCVSAKTNMISNIGDGIDATHTKKDNRMRLGTKKLNGALVYIQPENNKKLTSWYEKNMGSYQLIRAAIYIIRSKIKKSI